MGRCSPFYPHPKTNISLSSMGNIYKDRANGLAVELLVFGTGQSKPELEQA